ncbi:peroxiredoxin TSA1, partial [Didymella exigua CBS 183.55]
MASLERIKIGQRAPKFRCQALVSGSIQEVSLDTYICPTNSQAGPNVTSSWLVILFIPAAFSNLCPTEVLAFQESYEQFRKRNCSIMFTSVDTRNSLWYWQSIPRKHGGLGHVDIPLLSDTSNKIAKDYGVVVEELGIDIRGMFLIDGEGIVQQVTLDNCQIDRSVVETLRVLDAHQSLIKVGVPYPIDEAANARA